MIHHREATPNLVHRALVPGSSYRLKLLHGSAYLDVGSQPGHRREGLRSKDETR